VIADCTRVIAPAFSRASWSQRVEHRSQHSHVVARGPVHAGGRAGQAAVDVASAHHDGHLHPAVHYQLDLLRDRADAVGIRAVLEIAHERLARELEEDATKPGVAVRRGTGL
jgi:hypothetical protein